MLAKSLNLFLTIFQVIIYHNTTPLSYFLKYVHEKTVTNFIEDSVLSLNSILPFYFPEPGGIAKFAFGLVELFSVINRSFFLIPTLSILFSIEGFSLFLLFLPSFFI
jgi:hypothetical protein